MNYIYLLTNLAQISTDSAFILQNLPSLIMVRFLACEEAVYNKTFSFSNINSYAARSDVNQLYCICVFSLLEVELLVRFFLI